jgi:hypothetical protein
MKIDPALRTRLETLFYSLRKVPAAKAFPSRRELTNRLEKLVPNNGKGVTTVQVTPAVGTLFVTAAVEIWMRSVHSFLISASVTEVSPIWSSVSGYYSSHYSIRALGHLLGYFQLFRRKKIVYLQLQAGKHFCSFNPKDANHREHRFYWRLVKQDQHFASDPLFTANDVDQGPSDVAHRDLANYADHLCVFPMFKPLDAEALKNRVQHIADIQFTAPPIPRTINFPDVESVQVVAYHRIIRFRRFLDEIVTSKNRFWAVHRQPSWAAGYMNFQLTEQGGLAAIGL